MSGFGPKPVLAPPDDLGSAAAAAAGTGGDKSADKGGDKGGDKGSDKGSGAGGSGAGGGGQAAGADAGGKASATAAYRPEGLPDHLYGGTDKETVDKLYTAVNGFRKLESERGTVPKEPTGYGFEPSDKLKPYVANFDKDPVFGKVKDLALKAGVTDKQFGAFIPAILESFVEGGLVDKPVDANAQLMSLAPAGTYANDAEKVTAAGKRVTDNIAWADGAKAQKSFGAQSDAIADFLAASAASDPRAHHLVEYLREQAKQPGPHMGGGGAAAGFTEAGYSALLAKGDKLSAGSPEFKAWQTEKTDYAKKLWGDAPAHGGA